jgi:hypothetical protein
VTRRLAGQLQLVAPEMIALLTTHCQVPCSQCVARNHVCQPRCSSRRPRALRRLPERSQGSTVLAETIDPSSFQAANIDRFSDFALLENEPRSNDLFSFSNLDVPQGLVNFHNEDFMDLSYPLTVNNTEALEGSTADRQFPSIPLVNGFVDRSISLDFHMSPLEQQSLPRDPNQLLTPASTTSQPILSSQLNQPRLQETATQDRILVPSCRGKDVTPDDVLGHMVDLLAQPSDWHGLPFSNDDAGQVLSHDARDRIVAAVQLLLHRALCQARSTRSPERASHGLFGRIVALPPSHVLVHFIELYAVRVDAIQPYLGMAGSPTISIKDILQVDMADVGVLLVILLITQGAMLSDHGESLVLADGLTEICRVALNDVLENASITQPLVGGCAIQMVTLCAWSGRESFVSVRKIQDTDTLRIS